MDIFSIEYSDFMEFTTMNVILRVMAVTVVIQFFFTASAVLRVLKRTLLPHKRRC